jgi:hypothetical protein
MMAMVIHGVGKNGSHFERRGFRFPILRGFYSAKSTGMCDSASQTAEIIYFTRGWIFSISFPVLQQARSTDTRFT